MSQINTKMLDILEDKLSDNDYEQVIEAVGNDEDHRLARIIYLITFCNPNHLKMMQESLQAAFLSYNNTIEPKANDAIHIYGNSYYSSYIDDKINELKEAA